MHTEWDEEIINDLKYDDYILIIETYNTIGVRAKDYRLESGGYISSPREINYVDGLYGKYEKQFFDAASKNDNAVHVYLYEKGKFKEYRQFAKKDYDAYVYQGCNHEALLLNEFGLEPLPEETRAKVGKKLKAAEKFKQSLLYACYVGDTEKIIERAKTASKAQLNKKLDYIGTPLSFCAAHNDLEGFKKKYGNDYVIMGGWDARDE
ncbi:MAG: hypothetical protein K2N72_06640, partial [Oscillospiraceae bacterium]|nr:hypothetical protein [Oscillospiraceae bacterium]